MSGEAADEKIGYLGQLLVGLLMIGFGTACIHFNGWDYVVADWAISHTTSSGFYFGDSSESNAILIEVNSDWYGFAKLSPDQALFDSKVLNLAGLVMGLFIQLSGLACILGLYDLND